MPGVENETKTMMEGFPVLVAKVLVILQSALYKGSFLYSWV